MSACFVGGALSSYMTISLAPVALLQLTAPVVELTIVLTGAQNQTFSDRSVCVILRCKFNNQGGCRLLRSVPCQPSHICYLRSQVKSHILGLDLFYQFCLPGRIYVLLIRLYPVYEYSIYGFEGPWLCFPAPSPILLIFL